MTRNTSVYILSLEVGIVQLMTGLVVLRVILLSACVVGSLQRHPTSIPVYMPISLAMAENFVSNKVFSNFDQWIRQVTKIVEQIQLSTEHIEMCTGFDFNCNAQILWKQHYISMMSS